MPKRTESYNEWLIETLKDPQEAAAYLNAHLGEGGEDADELFLLALRNVAAAQGMSRVAEKADLGRESLYKTLSSNGDPKLSTLLTLLRALGLDLLVGVDQRKYA